MPPSPSHHHLLYFLVASLVLLVPSVVFAVVGLIAIVPPVLAGFGLILVWRYAWSLRPASSAAYRLRTHDLSIVMNALTATLMVLAAIGTLRGGDSPALFVSVGLYNLICVAVARHARRAETRDLSTVPAPLS